MKKLMAVLAAASLMATLMSAQAEFTKPSDAQIAAAAKDPDTIKALLVDASPAQASEVLLRAVQKVQTLEVDLAAKKEIVAKMFANVQVAMGAAAVVVIGDVASRMNPELLPTVAAGSAIVAQPGQPIALPLAPPIEPKSEGDAPPVATLYEGQ